MNDFATAAPGDQPSIAAQQPASAPAQPPADNRTTAGNGFGRPVVHLPPAQPAQAHGKFHRAVADAGPAPAASGQASKQGNDPILQKSRELLGKHRGIAYGEVYLSSATYDWVRVNLGALKAAGVTTVFVEIKDKNQPWIDDFLNGKITESDFRDRMQGTTEFTDAARMANLVVEARKLSINQKQPIKVVAMDVEDPATFTKDGETVAYADWRDRYEYANPVWAKKVTKEMNQQPNDAKYIMIAGAVHTNKMDIDILRGVDANLNIPSIDIYDNTFAELSIDKDPRISSSIEKSDIHPDRNTLVQGTIRESDFIAIVPDPVGERPFARLSQPAGSTGESGKPKPGFIERILIAPRDLLHGASGEPDPASPQAASPPPPTTPR